jgi:hypothetical protein
MYDWQNDFTYWYVENGALVEAGSLSEVPEDVECYGRIHDAVAFFPRLSMFRKSAHVVDSEDQALYLAIIAIAIERYGEDCHVFRGSNGEWELSRHKILYGATSIDVAAHYGHIVEGLQVRGLRTHSPTNSVLTPDDDDSEDEEIIFMPETIYA